VQFTLGFVFDGYAEYTDLRQSTDSYLRDLATLYVYQDPVIEEFKKSGGNEVLVSVFYSREGRTSALTLYCCVIVCKSFDHPKTASSNAAFTICCNETLKACVSK